MELQHQNNANKSNWLQMDVCMPLTLCPLFLVPSIHFLIIVHGLGPGLVFAHFFFVFIYLIVYICLRDTLFDVYNNVK